MAHYLVRATLNEELREELAGKLMDRAFVEMKPFGQGLTDGLEGARIQPDGRIVWEEEDYCTPPLAMEREAVLDHYFTEIEVERVQENAGWTQIAKLPSLWDEQRG